jgi:hypothetical protein
MTIRWSVLVFVCFSSTALLRGQGFQLVVTSDQVLQAARDANLPAAVRVFDDVMTRRTIRGDYRSADGAPFTNVDAFTKHRESRPDQFLLYVATPYMRAVATFADARRRYAPLPELSPDALNSDGVVVSVMPGESFGAADAIDDVVVRPIGSAEGAAIHATRRLIEPTLIINRAGGTRELSSGVFYFALSAFSDLPVDVICIGRNANETFRVDVQDLDPLALQR